MLEHLLGGEDTVPPERGLFLVTHLAHAPRVCQLRLGGVLRGPAAPGSECGEQTGAQLAGRGLRYRRSSTTAIAVSPEEAEVATPAEAVSDVRASSATVGYVVSSTPYNAQVRCLSAVLPPGTRVGTVDKFQGQEAPVVFFSMATSSGEMSRATSSFLFSRTGSTSRSHGRSALAVTWSASPKLLEVGCRSIEQMRMANALVRRTGKSTAVGIDGY